MIQNHVINCKVPNKITRKPPVAISVKIFRAKIYNEMSSIPNTTELQFIYTRMFEKKKKLKTKKNPSIVLLFFIFNWVLAKLLQVKFLQVVWSRYIWQSHLSFDRCATRFPKCFAAIYQVSCFKTCIQADSVMLTLVSTELSRHIQYLKDHFPFPRPYVLNLVDDVVGWSAELIKC